MGSEENFFCSRLKSSRRRKRLQKTDFDRKLIALYKEWKRLRDQVRNLGYEPLIPPVQKGWKRTFVLRDDVKKSKDAPFFEELLKKVNNVQYSHRKDFLIKRRRRGKKIYVERDQKLEYFFEWNFSRLKLTPDESRYFSERLVMDQKGCEYKIYEFNEAWRFTLKILPNIITKVKIKDWILEHKQDEIERPIFAKTVRARLAKLKGWRNYSFFFSAKTDNPLRNKPLHWILDEYYDKS
jgi:hypothetical protein